MGKSLRVRGLGDTVRKVVQKDFSSDFFGILNQMTIFAIN